MAGLTQRGHQVRLLHRSSSNMTAVAGLDFEPVVGDILDGPDELADLMSGCDWVFHVAAVSDYWRQESDWLYRVNVDGTRNMLRAAEKLPIKRFVYCSSLAALLPPKGGKAVDELNQFDLKPKQFPYAHSKHLAEEEVVRAFEKGLPSLIVNPSVVMGPGDLNEISGSLVVEATKGRLRFMLPGGINVVAVEDVVAGMIAAAEKGRNGERYVLAGTNVSNWQAAELISEITGSAGPWLTIPRQAAPLLAALVAVARRLLGNRIPLDANQIGMGCLDIFADGSKAAAEFGIDPTPIEEVIRRTYVWYQRNGYTS